MGHGLWNVYSITCGGMIRRGDGDNAKKTGVDERVNVKKLTQ